MDSLVYDDETDTTPSENMPAQQVDSERGDENVPESRKKLVERIQSEIKSDKKHHTKAFKRMRRDMQVATWGAESSWSEDAYRANITGRHVKMKTAALYAKNPRVTANRRETLDFQVWDEDAASLQLAMQTLQAAEASIQPQFDPMTGGLVQGPTELPPGFEQAQAVVADFKQGTERRQKIGKLGKTLEILFSYSMKEQSPIDFKAGLKQTVRRAITCGVGYVELGFQRETGPAPGVEDRLTDARTRLDHLRVLAEGIAEGEYDDTSSERAELEMSISSLANEPDIVMREGLVIDHPRATKVIPDRNTQILEGFIGASRVSIEYSYTVAQVEEKFGVDVQGKYAPYVTSSGSTRQFGPNDVMDDDYEWSPIADRRKDALVCVWKTYDKPSGLVYWTADGYHDFLQEPAPPEVFVEDFWPVYALTFNAVENEDELYPPSDVALILDMQREYNRSRQGLREHRRAARPRYAAAKGAFGANEDVDTLAQLDAFQMALLNIDSGAKLSDILQTVPVPGVDPNLYETNPIFTDTQLVAGVQEAQFGGVAKATATESAIAANATTASDGSSIDDLDTFLSRLARASGQILLKEMSQEQVLLIAGPGAFWPPMSLAEISSEVYLEVEAGSTGKPNQAVEINNWERMLPFLIQMPDVNPTWLARESIRRLDDRLDLTEAITAGIPSIISQNQMQQPSPGLPGQDPNAQGAEGANNGPAPPGGRGGTAPAFGSNQV